MDALIAIGARRSIREFKPDPIAPSQLKRIVEAGRLAPTARNVQPWEFVVVTDPDRRAQLAALASNGGFIADAPACIVVLSQPTKYYLEDGSAATANILLAATSLGLGGCWVAGDKKEYAAKVVQLVGAPGDLKLVSLIAIGYAATTPSPDKRPLAELLHWEEFGRKTLP